MQLFNSRGTPFAFRCVSLLTILKRGAMKIAFPLLNEKELAEDFAHANYLGIFDDRAGKTEMILLASASDNSNQVFSTMLSSGIRAVASMFYSYMSLRVLKENSIEPLKAVSMDLEENLTEWKSNLLVPFNVYEALLTGACASECSSCGGGCST